jgi:hypothetical protein
MSLKGEPGVIRRTAGARARALLDGARRWLGPRKFHVPDFARGEVRTALGARGCPICARVSYNHQRFLFWFLIEQYGTGPWIALLCRSLGFCPRHFADLAASGARYGLSYVAQYLGAWFARDLATLERSPPGRSRRRARRALLPTEPCPACRTCEQLAGWLARDLAHLLAEEAFRRAFCASDGLCLEHFGLTLGYPAGNTRTWLLEAQRSKLLKLRAALDAAGDGEEAATALSTVLGAL